MNGWQRLVKAANDMGFDMFFADRSAMFSMPVFADARARVYVPEALEEAEEILRSLRKKENRYLAFLQHENE